ncbi:MAG: NUDIX hydrolase [Patescibacteria group bacterium]|nr:NUDIX hydrolase [Patescibacteria group bacterium]
MAKDEIFDVVNEKDEVIGTATREECHSNPDLMHHLIHFTLVDRKKQRVFLTERSFKKDHDAGKFCFLGEHMLSGESYEDALKRGVKEELGFATKLFKEVAHKRFSYQSQTEFVKFFVVYWEGQKIDWDSEEMEKVLWVDIDDLANADYDYSEMTKGWIDMVDWCKL